ncbi:MAG: polysaccharide deacetylase family protein [Chloroflexota bacterium]|nr:polysaccharide deacetylase family protein [Chloroflexota bacterium]
MRITSVEVAPWKDDASFVYSVVFVEGTIDCLANAFPLSQQYGILGDVAVVAGQLGEKRHVERSSLNDYFHMGPEHLKFLLSQGWSVSNHSYSHPPLRDPSHIDFQQEIVESYHTLENALGQPVPIFSSWNSFEVYDTVRAWVERTPGYLGLTHASNDAEHINAPDFDPLSIWRNRLSEDDEIDFLPPWLSRQGFKPARVAGKWLVDVTHLVMYKTPQGHKCISPYALEGRFDQMRTHFGDSMWAANPDDVVRYRYLRRHCTPVIEQESGTRATVKVDFPQLPPQIKEGDLTFVVTLADDAGSLEVLGPEGTANVVAAGERRIRFTCRVFPGAVITVSGA